jgi:hypothetical protein
LEKYPATLIELACRVGNDKVSAER